MLSIGIIIVLIAGGIVALGLGYLIYRWYRIRTIQINLPLLEQRESSFTISGNLVQEHFSPISNQYSLTNSLLGRGSSAEVVIGHHLRTKRRYAIKIIDTTKKEVMWRYEREKNFLRDVEHPNVACLFEVYEAPTALFFVTDLCTGGHLGHVLQQRPHGFLDEREARRYIKQLLGALIHCHKAGICHRDVKLQNILKESHAPSAQVKLIDFGNAVRFLGRLPLTKVVGTTYTAAPEVFHKHYDERCDVWSLGVVAYILLCGNRPFERTEADLAPKTKDSPIISNILAGRFHFNHRQFTLISEEAVDFVKVCMERDFTRRLRAVDLLDHPWLVYNTATSPSHGSNRTSANNSFRKTPSENSMASLGMSHLSAFVVKQIIVRHQRSPQAFQARTFFMLPVAFSMSVRRLRSYRDVFQEIDRNANGEIERDEFRIALHHASSEVTALEGDALFDALDLGGRGAVSYLSFLAAALAPQDVDVNDFENGFRVLDREHKGYLTRRDLERVLLTLRPLDLLPSSPTFSSSQAPSSSPQRSLSLSFSQGRSFSFASLKEEDGEEKKSLGREQRLVRLSQLLDSLMEVVDLNRDQAVSYFEFLFALSDPSLLTSQAPLAPYKAVLSQEVLRRAPPSVAAAALTSQPSYFSSPSRSRGGDRYRRQSDGVVRLEGGQFRTRARSSFLSQLKNGGREGEGGEPPPVSPPPSLASSPSIMRLTQLNGQVLSLPPLPGQVPSQSLTSSLSPPSPTHHPRPLPPLSFPWPFWTGGAAALDPQQLVGKGREPLSHVDDSDDEGGLERGTPLLSAPLLPQPSHLSLASSLSSGGVGAGGEGEAPPGSAPAKPPSLVRRLSSALFPLGGMRGRALTSPAFFFSYAGGEREGSGTGTGLAGAGGGARGVGIGTREGEGQIEGERVWNESDDSLDRLPFPSLMTEGEEAGEGLLGMRRKSAGKSLDSQMFKELEGQMARALDLGLGLTSPSSPSHRKVVPIEGEGGEKGGDGEEGGKGSGLVGEGEDIV